MLSPKMYKNALGICEQARDVSGSLHALAGAISVSQGFDNAVYKPEYFKVWEVVDPVTYSAYGDKALWFMDSRILWTFDAVREYFNKPTIINNYVSAKAGDAVYRDSGLRIVPVGAASKSQHLFGRAGDLKIVGVAAEEARQEIRSHPKESAFRFITAMELDVSWLHIDCRNTNQDVLFTFTKE